MGIDEEEEFKEKVERKRPEITVGESTFEILETK
jgi:hypothetical protein